MSLSPMDIDMLVQLIEAKAQRLRRQHASAREERRRRQRGVAPHGNGRDTAMDEIERWEHILEKLRGLQP